MHAVDAAELPVAPEPEARQGNVRRPAPQARSGMRDAPDIELEKADRLPSYRRLERAAKLMRRHGLRHRQTPPDHRAGPGKPGFQLQNRSCLRRSNGIRHPKKLREPSELANRGLTLRILVVPEQVPPEQLRFQSQRIDAEIACCATISAGGSPSNSACSCSGLGF